VDGDVEGRGNDVEEEMTRRMKRDECGEMVEESFEVEIDRETSLRLGATVQYRGWYRRCGRLGHVKILHKTLRLPLYRI
jgi:hypothetical protein